MYFVLLILDNNENKNKFVKLFHKYHKLMYYYAYEILHNHADVEDAVQITYLKVFKNLHKINEDEERKIVNYMLTILKNTAFHIYNKNKDLISQLDIDANEFLIQNENKLTLQNLHFENFKSIIESLDEKYKTPLVLMYVYGFSIAEIAEIMDLSKSNVGTRIYRAKLKIKKSLCEMGEKFES